MKKFKTVGQNLVPQLSDKRRPILEKEVVEIEKKVLMVMSTLKENLEYLERSTEKWTNFNFKLEGFIAQTDSIIDRLKSILSETSPPEERLRKLDVSIYIFLYLYSHHKMLIFEIFNKFYNKKDIKVK